MVGEASAYVQGESLKAGAVFHQKAFQLPDQGHGEMEMIYAVIFAVIAILLFSFQSTLGVIGGLAGIITLFIAAIFFLVNAHSYINHIIFLVCAIFVSVGGFFLFAWIRYPYEKAVFRHRSDLDEFFPNDPIVQDWRYRLCVKMYGPVPSSSLKTLDPTMIAGDGR